VAQETGSLETWHELRNDLVDAGYAIEDEQVLDEPLQKPIDEDRIAQLLEDLSLEDFDSTGLAPLDETLPVSSVALPPEPPRPAAASPPPRPLDAEPKPKKKLISLVEELGLEDLQDDPEDFAAEAHEAPAAPPAAEAAEAAADLDETGMSWLDDVTGADEAAADRDEALFEEEDDFFDLAAELERELTEDDLADGVVVQPQEQSLEEIIEGFKQGVAEHLSPEDYETHFNLGIAYREMGLLDEAIGEFQLASKDDRYIVDCSSLLGICFLEKGLPDLAVRWYRKGLEAPSINDDATMGLLYDMGDAYLSLGDSEAASKTFIEVYGLDSNYRDVSAKLAELGAVP
jgi:tetratricopeptide (TPR) repeat protein